MGIEEVRTSAFVAERMREFGYDVATDVGGTGVVGTLYGALASMDSPGRCIAFRTKLDALPIDEKADVPCADKIGDITDGRVVVAVPPAPLGSPPQHWKLARLGHGFDRSGSFEHRLAVCQSQHQRN